MEEKKKKATLEERIEAFAKKARKIGKKNGHTDELIEKFIFYWTEYNDGGKKFKAEFINPFNIGRRMGTFKRNEALYGKKKTFKTEKYDAIEQYRREQGL